MWEYLIYIIYHELVNEKGLLDVKIDKGYEESATIFV